MHWEKGRECQEGREKWDGIDERYDESLVIERLFADGCEIRGGAGGVTLLSGREIVGEIG